jgi:hypothetical protein
MLLVLAFRKQAELDPTVTDAPVKAAKFALRFECRLLVSSDVLKVLSTLPDMLFTIPENVMCLCCCFGTFCFVKDDTSGEPILPAVQKLAEL